MKTLAGSVLGVLVFSTFALSSTITVSKDGQGNHTTIQAAIISASEGDEIVVLDSSLYEEDLTVGAATGLVASFTLRAAAGQSPVVRAVNAVNRVADLGNVGNDHFGFMLFGCQNALIDGLTFENLSTEMNSFRNASVVMMGDCVNVTIRNCIIRGAGGPGTSYNGDYFALGFIGVTMAPFGLSAENCLIEDSYIGIAITKFMAGTPTDPSAMVRGCTIRNCVNSAIESDNGAPPDNVDPAVATGTGNLFEDCWFENCDNPIDIGGGYSITKNCTIVSARNNGILVNYDGPRGTMPITTIVENTVVVGSSSNGIRIEQGTVQLQNCIFAGNTAEGIYLHDIGQACTVTADHCDVYQNDISDLSYEVRVDPSTASLLQLRLTNSNVVGLAGIYNGDIANPDNFDPEGLYADYCNVFTESERYTNVIVTNDRQFDPKYVSPSAGIATFTRQGFQLKLDSPVLTLDSTGGPIGSQGPMGTAVDDWSIY